MTEPGYPPRQPDHPDRPGRPRSGREPRRTGWQTLDAFDEAADTDTELPPWAVPGGIAPNRAPRRPPRRPAARPADERDWPGDRAFGRPGSGRPGPGRYEAEPEPGAGRPGRRRREPDPYGDPAGYSEPPGYSRPPGYDEPRDPRYGGPGRPAPDDAAGYGDFGGYERRPAPRPGRRRETGNYGRPGSHAEPDQYGEPGRYAAGPAVSGRSGEYTGQRGYARPGEYGGPADVSEPRGYAPAGGYGEADDYGEPGGLAEPGQYAGPARTAPSGPPGRRSRPGGHQDHDIATDVEAEAEDDGIGDGEPAPGRRLRRPGRSRAAAARRRRWQRRLVTWGGTAVVIAGLVVGIVYLTSSPAKKAHSYVTAWQKGEIRAVPPACKVLTATTLHQVMAGTPKVVPVGGQGECTFTVDAKPVFRILQIQEQAFAPSLAVPTGDGSATANAAWNFGQARLGILRPPTHSIWPAARITAISGLGDQAFSAVQKSRGHVVTERATVLVRYRNVQITVQAQAQESGGFGPVPVADLRGAALTAARAALAAVKRQPTV
ncbi:MAG TPA: hypothetical protein VF843_11995 [Streptosporangiaceae bacterium]